MIIEHFSAEDDGGVAIVASMRPRLARLIPTVLARHLRLVLRRVGPARSQEVERLALAWQMLGQLADVPWPEQDETC